MKPKLISSSYRWCLCVCKRLIGAGNAHNIGNYGKYLKCNMLLYEDYTTNYYYF